VLAFTLLACGGIPIQPPSQIVELPHNDFGDFVLLVYDQSGLVTGARAADLWQSEAGAGVEAHPESNEVSLSWTGGACAHGPKLAISGDSSALTLELDAAPFEFSAVPVECPAIGIPFAVTLTLSESVEQDALTLTLLSR
jgi:hypothetical protein